MCVNVLCVLVKSRSSSLRSLRSYSSCAAFSLILTMKRWEARLSPKGQVYYASHVTRSTQWERPVGPAILVPESAEARAREDRRRYERRSVLRDMGSMGTDGWSASAVDLCACLTVIINLLLAVLCLAATVFDHRALTGRSDEFGFNAGPRAARSPGGPSSQTLPTAAAAASPTLASAGASHSGVLSPAGPAAPASQPSVRAPRPTVPPLPLLPSSIDGMRVPPPPRDEPPPPPPQGSAHAFSSVTGAADPGAARPAPDAPMSPPADTPPAPPVRSPSVSATRATSPLHTTPTAGDTVRPGAAAVAALPLALQVRGIHALAFFVLVCVCLMRKSDLLVSPLPSCCCPPLVSHGSGRSCRRLSTSIRQHCRALRYPGVACRADGHTARAACKRCGQLACWPYTRRRRRRQCRQCW
jgi:hypothetical protein